MKLAESDSYVALRPLIAGASTSNSAQKLSNTWEHIASYDAQINDVVCTYARNLPISIYQRPTLLHSALIFDNRIAVLL